jgi:hypothetical protein
MVIDLAADSTPPLEARNTLRRDHGARRESVFFSQTAPIP